MPSLDDSPKTPATSEPEVTIVVSQLIRGKRVQTVKRIDLFMRAHGRIGIADHAIDEALGELRYYQEQGR